VSYMNWSYGIRPFGRLRNRGVFFEEGRQSRPSILLNRLIPELVEWSTRKKVDKERLSILEFPQQHSAILELAK